MRFKLFNFVIVSIVFQQISAGKIHELCPRPINGKPNAEEKHCECVLENSSQWGELSLVINCSEMKIDEFNTSAEVLPENSKLLDLSYNRIRKLPMFRGDELKVLDVSYNEITEIDDYNFAGLPHLAKLNLGRNKIELLSVNAFSALSNLVELDLSHNSIQTLSMNTFLPAENLGQLELSYNFLGKEFEAAGVDLFLHFGVTPNLHTFKCEGCNLTRIDLGRGVGLRSVSLSNNNLTKLDDLAHNVHEIDLSMNPIESLTKGFIPLHTNVEMLILQDMPLLKTVDADCFAGFTNLKFLSFRGSRNLEEIHGDAFGQGLTMENADFKLNVFNLQGTKLKTLNETLRPALRNLQALDLAGTPLVCDCDIAWVKSFEFETNAQCAEPPHLQGILLSGVPENKLQCKLFPKWFYTTINGLIVLLVLIGCSLIVAFVFLKFKRVNENNRHQTTIGQASPYAPVTTSPLKPDSAYA